MTDQLTPDSSPFDAPPDPATSVAVDAADLTREAFIGEALRAGRLLSVAAELAKVPLSVDAVTE